MKVDSENATIKATIVKVYENWAEANMVAEKYKDARGNYEEIMKYQPERKELLEKIAVTYDKQGKAEDAARVRATMNTAE